MFSAVHGVINTCKKSCSVYTMNVDHAGCKSQNFFFLTVLVLSCTLNFALLFGAWILTRSSQNFQQLQHYGIGKIIAFMAQGYIGN